MAKGCMERLMGVIHGIHGNEQEFASFAHQLPKISISNPHSMADSNREIILWVQAQDEYFWGQLFQISIGSNSGPWAKEEGLYFFRDVRGQVHFFDQEHLQRTVAYMPEEGSFFPQDVARLHPVRSSREYVEIVPLRRQVCGHYRDFRALPEFQKISSILSRNLSHFGRSHFPWQYVSQCPVMSYALLNSNLWLYFQFEENWDTFFFSEHVSNFLMGLPLMMAIDQCLKALTPMAHQKILMASLGFNTLLNIYLEVDIPGLKQPDIVDALSRGIGLDEVRQDARTDIPDLISGMLGTISYAYFSLWLEKTTWANKALLCQ